MTTEWVSDAIRTALPFLAGPIDAWVDCRRHLVEDARIASVPAGAVVAESGARSQSLFLLQKGVAKEIISGQKGTEVTVALMRPGDVSGVASALDGGPRSVRLVAVTECEFLVISQQQFVRELDEHPEIHREALRYVSRQVRDAHQWISNLV